MLESNLRKPSLEELEREIAECEKIIKDCDRRLSLTCTVIDAVKDIIKRKLPPDIPNWRERQIYSEQRRAEERLNILKERRKKLYNK